MRKVIVDEEFLYLRVAEIFKKNCPQGNATPGDVTVTVFLAISQLLTEGVFQLVPDDSGA